MQTESSSKMKMTSLQMNMSHTLPCFNFLLGIWPGCSSLLQNGMHSFHSTTSSSIHPILISSPSFLVCRSSWRFRLSTHPPYPKHKRRWQEKDSICLDCHLWCRSSLLCDRLQACPDRLAQACRWTQWGGIGAHRRDHAKSLAIQHPQVLSQSSKGHQGWHLLSTPGQQLGQQEKRGFGEDEKDETPPWSPSCQQSPCPWAAHQDHWSSWSHDGCEQD